jgi:TorA maturation chaperone TorD
MSNRGTRAMVQTTGDAYEPTRKVDCSGPESSDVSCTDDQAADSTTSAIQISPGIEDVDIARSKEYALLAALLARAPDAALLKVLAAIRGDSTPLGNAHAALAQAAENAHPERVEREFFDVFIGVGRGELLPYGSYYLTGFLNERPLARLRDDLRALGIVRTETQTEPEDHAAILCEIMAGLITGGSLAATPNAQEKIFEKHLAPWIGRFFADLEGLKRADFYRRVGAVGRLFIDIETEAFAMPSSTSRAETWRKRNGAESQEDARSS